MGTRRQRRSRDQWVSIVESQISSGLTIADYCQANDIGVASFAKWKRRLHGEASKPSYPVQNTDFMPVKLLDSTETETVATVTLSLGTNITLTINTSGNVA